MNMPPLSKEATLTDRYQTTVPEVVRKALHLHKRDKILYTVRPDGQVLISRVNQEDEDPVLSQFLNFLAKDIGTNPQHISPLTSDTVQSAQSLTSGVEVDLDQLLADEDE